MGRLNRKQVDAVQDCHIKEVEVPEWGGSVFLKTLSTNEVIALQKAEETVTDEKRAALSVTFCLCDADGKRLYSEKEVDELCEKNPKVILRLFYEALEVNKTDDKAKEEREDFSSSNPSP